jgi:hypothetical protein
MRLLVCGSRDWADIDAVRGHIKGLAAEHPALIIVEGGARGADTIARDAAEELGLCVEEYPAEWARYGRAAGPVRNQQMLDEGRPDAVAAFFSSPESRGTADMVRRALAAGLPVDVFGKVPEEFQEGQRVTPRTVVD